MRGTGPIKRPRPRRGGAQGLRARPGRLFTVLGLVGLIALLTLAVWRGTYSVSLGGMDTRLGDELGLVHRAVRSEIERFRTLPGVLAQDQRITDLLADHVGDNIRAVNLYLRAVRERTGASELFLLDDKGLTLAASNWDKPLSFVGQNYAFRPYFKDAISQGEGRFYAVGVTTGIPGYFLSSRVVTPTGRVGVVVVKVDLSSLAEVWQQAGSLTALADNEGVIFLAGPRDWVYRPLHPLSARTLAEISEERKYDGIGLEAAAPLLPPGIRLDRKAGHVVNGLLYKSDLLEPDGWRIVGARAVAPVRTFASVVAALTALSAMLLSIVFLYSRQRRQLIKFRLDQHRVLEQRVARRTRELAHEVEERRRAEQELRAAQDELVQAAKLAALGQMSAAIVHEISQPLAAMETTLAAADALADRGAHDKVAHKLVRARSLTKRIRRTIKHLRSFARKDEGGLKRLSAAECVQSALELATPRARALGVGVAFVQPQELAAVRANAVRLEQVVLNLVLNALDAVEGQSDGKVRVRIAKEQGSVVIGVEDNGAGIAEQISDRITEPFFTTKSGSEGMGLGLSISQNIVGELGGELRFFSASGKGTKAEIVLPAAQAEHGAPRMETLT